MTDTPSEQLPTLQRVPSGIAGLDRILQGGIFKGGSYLLIGPPGAGKTILGNQVCFNHVASGGRALYVSLLAETSSRMMAHMQPFRFFTLAPIADTFSYLSGYATLEEGGLDGLITFLRSEMRRQRVSLMVIDGTITLEQVAPSVQEWKKFLHDINASAEILGCTIIFLMQYQGEPSSQPEQTMVDGVIELKVRSVDMRIMRELEVRKFRGSHFLEGKHSYDITEDGLVVHPRTEAAFSISSAGLPPVLSTQEDVTRQRIGITQLDEMLRGGLHTNSTTLLLGAAGTGKTLLGSHFLLQGAIEGQRGLYFGFYETPVQLKRKMERFKLDTSHFAQGGLLDVLWQSPLQDSLDVLAERLIQATEERGIQRLFLDGIGGFQRTAASAERLDLFLIALFTALRTREVTIVCSVELPDLFSPNIALPAQFNGLTFLVENILLLRYVELHSQLYRLISIMKMRESGYDTAIREFRITDNGIEVAATFVSAESILTGVARPSSLRDDSSFQGQQI